MELNINEHNSDYWVALGSLGGFESASLSSRRVSCERGELLASQTLACPEEGESRIRIQHSEAEMAEIPWRFLVFLCLFHRFRRRVS